MTERALSELQLSAGFLERNGAWFVHWEKLIFFRELYRSILIKSGYDLGIE